jgi:hypothetical protein
MAERRAAGEWNSSVTRVWPVFLQLLDRDSTGKSWLKDLLELAGKQNVLAASMSQLDCTIAADLRGERPFTRYEPAVRLPRCLEYDAPAPERFLRWLIQHPEGVDRSKLSSEAPDSPSETHSNRSKLWARDEEAIESALSHLALVGSRDARGKGAWWAFEGPTSVDCFLETLDFVLTIEGKRTEPLSEGTEWVKLRNQLARNLEVAQGMASGRRYGVLLIVENEKDFVVADHRALSDRLKPDLPHYDDAERDFLARHFLGRVTWQGVCEATRVAFEKLPGKSADFYDKYSTRVV